MNHRDHVEAIAVQVDDLAAAVAGGPISDPVPTCSGWAVADLAVHVGEFCGFWSHVLCEGTGREKTPFPAPPEGDAMARWFAEIGAQLVSELEVTPVGTEVWTWFDSDRSAGFVARRCAHELAVHRFDAQSARGTPDPIPSELAVDGIAEILDVLVSARDRTGTATAQTMHLHGTDADNAEWLATLLPDRIDVTRDHAKADLALRGAVSDLELILYRRPTLGTVELFGDQSVLDAWYAEFEF